MEVPVGGGTITTEGTIPAAGGVGCWGGCCCWVEGIISRETSRTIADETEGVSEGLASIHATAIVAVGEEIVEIAVGVGVGKSAGEDTATGGFSAAPWIAKVVADTGVAPVVSVPTQALSSRPSSSV